MTNTEVVTRQSGIGYLILKSGMQEQVGWEIDLLSDGSLGPGCIHGDEEFLTAAAEDGCANLRLSIAMTVAIAIEGHENGTASFVPLLVSRTPDAFRAKGIAGSSPILDGTRFSIEFSAEDGQTLLVVIPTNVMRDYVPVLQKVLPPPPRSSDAAGVTIRLAAEWGTTPAHSYPYVCLFFNDDPPLGFSPDDARQLAAELIEGAKKIEERAQTAH